MRLLKILEPFLKSHETPPVDPGLVTSRVEPKGKTTDGAKILAVNAGTAGVVPKVDTGVGGRQIPGELKAGKSGLAHKLIPFGSGPIRPLRENYATEEAFDAVFLKYQDAQMARLAEEYPEARHFGQVYHGADLPPETVFVSGLPKKGDGDDFDLQEHQREFMERDLPPEKQSALRGACADARIPAQFAGEGGWVYVLVPRGGSFPLEQALGRDLVKGASGEAEHSFAARQPGCQIYGAFKVGEYSDAYGSYRLGPLVLNPNFKPVR